MLSTTGVRCITLNGPMKHWVWPFLPRDISGTLSIKGISLNAGKAFRGERVGLKETLEDGCYEVWWCSTKVGVIDLKKKSITMGKGC